MQLIYRGHVYDYTPPKLKPYIKPRAINWRFQAPGETYSENISAEPYVKPRAINWRFKMAT
ncbi:hypothetical protein NIES2119_25195 [[Phormidium ambiguum] IAM M-71]|uniref:DUF4278 domain-containing protein n=1 Tax=[Phormidium ambiguum] IAM M-71 TaxID=454136 RepID=A0A1U7I8K0_9CYAN|nr:hypothetical protein [Phormidium ambiguum]OKH32725.1 hypothetical protein NIES2119_25195 [Phormidium ambiguum IAM M-71]